MKGIIREIGEDVNESSWPLYDKLGGEIPYEAIRLVVRHLEVRE